MKHLTIASLLIITLSSNAEIVTDGTLGQNINLPGPDFQIGADLGQQHGGNLFHSFQDFNLNSAESATFSGPNSVQNILSRVTGGNPSNIDGLIRSTIPNADMYFLNPYGIMFGPNAQLDVQGSFHASTADYLRLGENGRFDALNPSDSLLTIAPIASFGFLTDSPKSISTQDSTLAVPYGQTLSLIGGDLNLNGNSPIVFDEQGFMVIFASSKLSALAGRINLASVASQGEVIPSESGLDLNAEGGTITANNTLMEVSGRGSGSVFVRGGQFFMDDAVIQAKTMADENGKGINLKLTDSIDIKGEFYAIMNDAMDSGNAGAITINVPYLTVTGSVIGSTNFDTGDAGDISIKAKQILLDKGGIVGSETYGKGQSGDININATESVFISGRRKGRVVILGTTKQDNISTLATVTSYNGGKSGSITITTGLLNIAGGSISTDNYGISDSNDITVNADKIIITGGGLITSTAFRDGNGGKININSNTMSISGRRLGLLIISVITLENNQSGIVTMSFGKGAAGNISVAANDLIIDDYAGISAGTLGEGVAGDVTVSINNLFMGAGSEINSASGGLIGKKIFIGQGPGGNVHVIATDNITNSAGTISTQSLGIGQGGNVKVETNHLNIKDGGIITANAMGTGNAGNVAVQANTIKITNGSTITTSAKHATGGNMTIVTPNLLFLREGQMTTSVQGGSGDGGNITIENPNFVVLNQGQIKAQADAGHGGNIRIVADQFITSPNSLISASSNLGLDGEVAIESIDVDLTGALKAFGINFLNAAAHMRRPCTIEDIMEPSTFYVFHLTGSQPSPADFIANELVLIEEEEDIDLKTEVKEAKQVDWTSCRPELLVSNI
ncbi:filamentous hemagglutinin N-terminal domain-containing protein [Candidatus Halobeggiatoa sp. HSG11]|nr:filamentous hemagglutinin N-terminal domain-containing protein [Candidatus Halobeggiatoa sp. HSG11]